MIALATVLSICKLVEMPYGGSVTLASMLPILIVSYRHGIKYGLGSAFVFAVIQQLLGLNNLSYVTTWQSILAVIMLDYVIAFTVIGLGGVFRKIFPKSKLKIEYQPFLLGLGMLFVCLLRYLFHTVAGATVWAGLSIPSEAALLYSVGYNATYMIPETIVNVLSAVWIGSVIALSKDIPTPVRHTAFSGRGALVCEILRPLALLFALATVGADTLIVFVNLQSPDTGEFALAGLDSVNWTLFFVILGVGAVLTALCLVLTQVFKRRSEK